MDSAAPLTVQNLRALLIAACEEAGSQRAWANRYGILPSVVSETINGRRDPSGAIVNALGLVQVTRYLPIKRAAKTSEAA